MQLIMLVQQEHLPIPEGIAVLEDFGTETIRSNTGRLAIGKAMVVEGEREKFVEWLKPFDGIWMTHNPLVGWKVFHIKDQ